MKIEIDIRSNAKAYFKEIQRRENIQFRLPSRENFNQNIFIPMICEKILCNMLFILRKARRR